MKMSPSFRRLAPWTIAIMLSVAASFGLIEAVRLYLENNYRETLSAQSR